MFSFSVRLASAGREGIQDLFTYDRRAHGAGTRELLQVKCKQSRSTSSGIITT